jgi:hypothetical protein
MAYGLSPLYRNSPLVYGLACILYYQVDEGTRVFQAWYDRRPEDVLARWGLAEHLVLRGEYDRAAELFAPSVALAEHPSLRTAVLSKILRREKTLVDEEFLTAYKARLNAVQAE